MEHQNKETRDLNKLRILAKGRPDQPLGDPMAFNGAARCYFRDIEERFLAELAEPDVQAVVGCVAWLTSKRILSALAKKRFVSIVVQKEDFLRPDALSGRELRAAYGRFQNRTSRLGVGLDSLSTMSDATVEAVRCLGNHNSAKHPAHPRMHHKFAVFCRHVIQEEDGSGWEDAELIPTKVWTGSFNFTYNGTQSLENAVVLEDPIIARAYYREWEQVFALSEPLNWEKPWVAPEYRIGS